MATQRISLRIAQTQRMLGQKEALGQYQTFVSMVRAEHFPHCDNAQNNRIRQCDDVRLFELLALLWRHYEDREPKCEPRWSRAHEHQYRLGGSMNMIDFLLSRRELVRELDSITKKALVAPNCIHKEEAVIDFFAAASALSTFATALQLHKTNAIAVLKRASLTSKYNIKEEKEASCSRAELLLAMQFVSAQADWDQVYALYEAVAFRESRAYISRFDELIQRFWLKVSNNLSTTSSEKCTHNSNYQEQLYALADSAARVYLSCSEDDEPQNCQEAITAKAHSKLRSNLTKTQPDLVSLLRAEFRVLKAQLQAESYLELRSVYFQHKATMHPSSTKKNLSTPKYHRQHHQSNNFEQVRPFTARRQDSIADARFVQATRAKLIERSKRISDSLAPGTATKRRPLSAPPARRTVQKKTALSLYKHNKKPGFLSTVSRQEEYIPHDQVLLSRPCTGGGRRRRPKSASMAASSSQRTPWLHFQHSLKHDVAPPTLPGALGPQTRLYSSFKNPPKKK